MHSFATILTDLRAVLAARAAKDWALSALLALVWTRLGRIAARFERLVARWRAGTLPSPRPSRAGQPRKHAPKPNFPSAPAWLVARVGYTAAAYGSQLQHALTDPEFAAFLAAVPQAGRILRPLCRMLGVELPAPLRRQPRPRPARPKPPPKPQPIPFRVPLPKGLGLSRRKRYFGI